jgi:hypothetical protein
MPHKRDGPTSLATAGAEKLECTRLLPLFDCQRKSVSQDHDIASERTCDPPQEPITIIVDGAAVAKGRPRFVRRTGIAFTPSHVRKYESYARLAASEAMHGRMPLQGPIRLELVVELPIPAWPRSALGK